MNMCRT